MSDPNPQQTINTPVDAKPSASEPLIFTMPAEYRGGGVGKKLVEPAKEPPKSPPVPAPRPVLPPAVPPVLTQPKKKSKTGLLIIIGICVLVLFAGGGYALVRFSAKPAPTPVAVAPTPKPVPKPTPTPTPKPTPTPTPTPEPFPSSAQPGKDTDSDGLTDLEETVVYGTNPRLPDSDNDGFLDGNEVFHRYNPQGLAPGTLLESGLVKLYDDAAAGTTLGYSILYPSIWHAAPEIAGSSSVTFTATTGEVVSLSLEPKSSPSQTVAEWYVANNPTTQYVVTTTKNGYASVTTEDKLKAYIDAGNQILVLSYDTGIKGTIDYLQTFQMMVNSVVVE